MKWNEDEGAFELWATGHVSTCDDASVLFAYGTMVLGGLCGSVIIGIMVVTMCKALFEGARDLPAHLAEED